MMKPALSQAATAGWAAPSERHPWRLVVLLAAICFVGHFNREGLAVAANLQIMRQYEISPTRMGTIYSAFLACYTVMMIPGGWFTDRRGPRLSLAIVCLGSALFVVLTATVGLLITSGALAFAAFLGIRGLMGVVNAPLHPARAKAVSLGVPLAQRSAANGVATGAALLGVASTFVVLGTMVQWLDWTWALIVSAVATAALGLVWVRYAGTESAVTVDRPAPQSFAPAKSTVIERPLAVAELLRRNKNLLLLTASYAAVGYFQYLFFYWMHYYFQTVLELGTDLSKYYASIPPLAMALGMPIGGWMSDRMLSLFGWRAARAGFAMAAMSASAGLLVLGTRATEPGWIVTWLSLALGVLGMVEGPFWVTAVEAGGNRGGLSAGIFNTGGNAGGIVAPVATPWVSVSMGYGWGVGIGLGAVVCLAGAVLWYWIDPTCDDEGGAEPVVAGLEPSYIRGTGSR